MELDQNVAWPPRALPIGGAGTAGDNVIYSTRPGDVPFQDPGIGARLRRAKGWYKANADSTFLIQVWSPSAAAWLTINGDGVGVVVTSGNIMDFQDRRPSGDFRIVINFAVAPTTYEHSSAITFTNDADPEVAFP